MECGAGHGAIQHGGEVEKDCYTARNNDLPLSEPGEAELVRASERVMNFAGH